MASTLASYQGQPMCHSYKYIRYLCMPHHRSLQI